MTLLDAPLPRMAGFLPFMRARTGTLSNLKPGMVAVVGAGLDGAADDAETAFGPLALRETSAYFGSHFAAGMARAMDIDQRRPLRQAAVAGRLLDLGDLDPPTPSAVQAACTAIAHQSAIPLLLGGDGSLVDACRAGLQAACPGTVQVLHLGEAACAGPIHVALDATAIGAVWHGTRHASRFDGPGLRQARIWLRAAGTLDVVGVSITGLAPARQGLSINKAGQRLLLTAILDLLYARLDALDPA